MLRECHPESKILRLIVNTVCSYEASLATLSESFSDVMIYISTKQTSYESSLGLVQKVQNKMLLSAMPENTNFIYGGLFVALELLVLGGCFFFFFVCSETDPFHVL